MKNINIVNKRAKFDYEFIETYQCGLVLFGKEVNSIREGNCSLSGTYCYVSENNEVFIKGSFVKNYVKKNQLQKEDFDEYRERKLLLTKKEIRNLKEYTSQKGFTLIPYRIYSDKGLIKCELKICKGKKTIDKRETIKERDNKRNLDRISKLYK